MCGYFQYKKQIHLPLLRDMPHFLHIRSREEPELAWLNHLANTLAHESRSFNPGRTVVVECLGVLSLIMFTIPSEWRRWPTSANGGCTSPMNSLPKVMSRCQTLLNRWVISLRHRLVKRLKKLWEIAQVK
ncbi:MAG: cupin domain-containing protein [Gammaproteobacteria bacterium]|nr:cupin domain-containing protein [Gammaproteobacteria bacterium]